jgi:hypothetical protein
MATSFTLTYKDEIEKLKEFNDFEARGDAIYMHHKDDEARLEWAFYRPSGSHPEQVSDDNVMVSAMAFNHSRLGALQRFKLLHKEIIKDDKLRIKVRNRSRMLFRAMVDDDFLELVEVLKLYPVFLDLAYDQVINGRIWNEKFADPYAASEFLRMFNGEHDDKLTSGVYSRLQPIQNFNIDDAHKYLIMLINQIENLHCLVRDFFYDAYVNWIDNKSLHPLQVLLWQKNISKLKG